MPDEQGRKETETLDTHDPYAEFYENRFLWEPWLILSVFVFAVVGLVAGAANKQYPSKLEKCPQCGQEICNG